MRRALGSGSPSSRSIQRRRYLGPATRRSETPFTSWRERSSFSCATPRRRCASRRAKPIQSGPSARTLLPTVARPQRLSSFCSSANTTSSHSHSYGARPSGPRAAPSKSICVPPVTFTTRAKLARCARRALEFADIMMTRAVRFASARLAKRRSRNDPPTARRPLKFLAIEKER
jgi:hypothetical protein